jgi:hypothetical protein
MARQLSRPLAPRPSAPTFTRVSERESNHPRNSNQRVCFRAIVPGQLAATASLRLGDGEMRLPIIELSLATEGHRGGLRLGPPGAAVVRLEGLRRGSPVPLQILLPGDPPLPADGIFLRWEENPRRPVLRYQLSDRRAEEPLRRFWAECQRYYLQPV